MHSLEDLKAVVAEADQQLQSIHETELERELGALQERLNDPRHFVAVFGAFSAGKSSLINALLKDNTLAVSPHPTTAAITQVQASQGSGDPVAVTAKTSVQMWEDVRLALGHLHMEAHDLEDAVRVARRLKPADFPPGFRRHVGFLKAMATGYDEMHQRLDTTWTCDASELADLTATESKACYIQGVSVEHPAELLQDGLVLVDTPGVDSIHRRHTDVAFEYMRRADAILFVLYYTHAFARSDEAFLSQLAQVQDITGVNKLFVVINAVDLAADDEEREHVRSRVVSELRKQGIAEPRVYEVSSQLAYAAGQQQMGNARPELEALIRQRLRLTDDQALPATDALLTDSGLPQLTEDVRGFLSEQSIAIAQSAVNARFRQVAQTLQHRIERFERERMEDEQAAAERRLALQELANRMQASRDALAAGQDEEERALRTEWEELIFHSGHRIRLSFGQNFRAAFHPGQFRSKGNPRPLLEASATELVEAINRQIESETRTFGLRAHGQMEQAMKRFVTRLLTQAEQAGADDLPNPPVEVDDALNRQANESAEEIEWLPERANLSWRLVQPYFRAFSSPEQFFERGGQKEMLQAAEDPVCTAAAETISHLTGKVSDQLISLYRDRLMTWIDGVVSRLSEDASTHAAVDASTVVQYQQVQKWFDAR